MFLPVDYLFAAGAVAALLFLRWFVKNVHKFVTSKISQLCKNRYLTKVLFPRSRICAPITARRFLLILCSTAGAVSCNLIGVADLQTAGNRAGHLAVLNIVLLLCSHRPNFSAWALQLPLQSLKTVHGFIGFMALAQSLIHVVIIAQRSGLDLSLRVHVFGLMVSFSDHAPLQYADISRPAYRYPSCSS